MPLSALHLSLLSLAAASPLVASVGSSYAFGYGLQVPIGGYLSQALTKQTGTTWTFDNFAVSGSKLKNITAYQAPKLQGLSPDIIYMLSGGNDLNYNTCLGNPSNALCPHPEAQSVWQTDFEAALDAIFQNVANPTTVTLYVVTYPIAIGPATNCGQGNAQCPETNATLVNQLSVLYTDQVNFTVAALSDWQGKSGNANYATKLIPMRQNSKGHEVGSPSPWVNGANVTNGSWHPNADGASNISNFILQQYNQKTTSARSVNLLEWID